MKIAFNHSQLLKAEGILHHLLSDSVVTVHSLFSVFTVYRVRFHGCCHRCVMWDKQELRLWVSLHCTFSSWSRNVQVPSRLGHSIIFQCGVQDYANLYFNRHHRRRWWCKAATIWHGAKEVHQYIWRVADDGMRRRRGGGSMQLQREEERENSCVVDERRESLKLSGGWMAAKGLGKQKMWPEKRNGETDCDSGHWIQACPSKQKVQQNNKYARSQSWPLWEILHFLLEAAHMFPGAGWMAPPWRTEREREGGGGKMSPSVCRSGELKKVRSPPGKEGGLGQISSNTDSVSQFPGLVLHGCHVTANVCQPWDGQPNRICARENTYGRNIFMPLRAFITFGRHGSSTLQTLKQCSMWRLYAQIFLVFNVFNYSSIFFQCGLTCVWFCSCESGGLAISLADSGHLAEGFGDRHCLLNTITPIFMPCLRCPRHSLGSPFTPEEALWNGWEMTDGMSGMDGTKDRVQVWSKAKKKKKKATIPHQDPNQYLATDKASRSDVCCCSVLGLITHHRSWASAETLDAIAWSSSSWLGNVCWLTDGGSSHIFNSDSVVFLKDRKAC